MSFSVFAQLLKRPSGLKDNLAARVATTLLLAGLIAGGTAADISLAGVGVRAEIAPGLERQLDAGPGPYRVWVFFADKGLHSSAARERAVATVAAGYDRRAAERRRLRSSAARRGEALFNFQDLSVHEPYVVDVAETGARVRVRSKWLNAVSAVATSEQISAIATLPCVTKVQQVARARRPEPLEVRESALTARRAPRARETLDYGNATAQLTQINLIGLHDAGYTGQGIVVGVLDTGFRRDHDVFNQPGHEIDVIAEYDFVNDDPNTAIELGDLSTQHSHGTMILGTLAAYLPGALVGGAYDASFILAKTEDMAGEYQGEEDNYVAGLEFVEANGGDMVTSSLGYINWYAQADLDGQTAVTTIAVNTATSLGMHCVTAAGNDYHDSDPFTSSLIAPSDALQVITAGAVTSSGTTSSFSSDGPSADGRVKPELLAQGSSTQTISPSSTSTFSSADGTSLSTPLIGAAVACLIQARPTWSVDVLRQQLFINADYDPGGLDFDPLYIRGYGILNALATHQNASGIHVTPNTNLASEGEVGGPFSPANTTYSLENNGDIPLDYLVTADQAWINIANGSGTVPVGGTVDVIVSINAQADLLGQGHYEATLDFVNTTDHEGDTQRQVTLDVARTIISASPDLVFQAQGPLGGPFAASQTYTVTSERPTPVDVEVVADQPWILVSPEGAASVFTLEGLGASMDVTVGFSSLATVLPPGTYTGNLLITNLTSGEGSTTRGVNLEVGGPQPVYVLNFDVDPGWSGTGDWAFGQPTGGGSHDGDPTSGYTGFNVYGFNLNGDYTDNMPEYSLMTTAFDCSLLDSVHVRFWRWLGVESASFDQAAFQVSLDRVVWTTIWSNASEGGAVSDSSWIQVEYDISAVADHQPAVYLRWLIGPTDTSVTYPGWNIDDLEILGVIPTENLSLVLDESQLSWTPRPENLSYDIVKGDLEGLRTSAGDFTSATQECLGDNVAQTALAHGSQPVAGQGFWWLVRGITAGGPTTYDAAGGEQVGQRDAEIEASGVACP